MALSVQEMLQRPFFSNANILAGKKGLHREVKWAHIIEIERFGHLLNGHEIILTTGIGWADDEEKCLSYLQQLLDYHASALCIELVVHAKQLPKKMLDLAEEHDFPVISFTEEVRFIDITKDLHEQILGHHEDIWIELERFHQKLNKTLTTYGTIGDFLRLLHQETNKNIALFYHDQHRFFPTPSDKQQKVWMKSIKDKEKNNFYAHPIYLLNDKIGELLYLEPLQQISRFDELALKRCSEIVNQYFWRHHHQIEIQQMERNKWMLDAIHTSKSHEEIIKKINKELPGSIINDAIIGVKPEVTSLITKDKEQNVETRFMMAFRSILLEFRFELFTVNDKENNLYIMLIINQQSNMLLPRLKEALQLLENKNEDLFSTKDLRWISFGKVFSDYSYMGKSYRAALSTLDYRRKAGSETDPFYSNLGIYRVIDQMKNKNEVNEIIIDYIDPLLKHDEEKGTELVKTLQIYLQNLGQKNETAQDLHIVRQTLYHRLNKIEQLLGMDYMAPQNRFMIEFAIKALEFRP